MRHQFDPIKTTKTSEVYRDPLVHQQRDDYLGSVNPVGSRTCDDACRDDDACDEGNRFAEALFFDDRRQHRLTIEAARIRNTFGPRMQRSDGRVSGNGAFIHLRSYSAPERVEPCITAVTLPCPHREAPVRRMPRGG